MFNSHPLFQLLQGPGCDAFPGLPLVTAHSEGTLWWRPHSLGYRSEERPDGRDSVPACTITDFVFYNLCLYKHEFSIFHLYDRLYTGSDSLICRDTEFHSFFYYVFHVHFELK